jgi:hypothetical protein
VRNFDFQVEKYRAPQSGVVAKRQTMQHATNAKPMASPTSRQDQIGPLQLSTRPAPVNTALAR